MENLKIKVNSEAESKEAQELFFELDYNWFKKGYMEVKTPETIMSFENGALSTGIRGSINHKEITLPELRDLVVLNRNDVGDATHTDPNEKESLYFRLFGDWWNLFTGGKWQQFCHMDSPRAAKLKPIEKPMKEYLRKNSSGAYSYIGTVHPEHVSDFMIEIPEGAKILTKGIEQRIFWNDDLSFNIDGHNAKEWRSGDDFHRYMNNYKDTVEILWQRHTNPEELPFIDDEPLQSLNDQYAEIEKVRQSAWQKQEGGSHYKNLKIQPMQYALENKLDYAQANVVKYVTRHKEKNGKEDLLKAIHNLELMIEFYYGDEK